MLVSEKTMFQFFINSLGFRHVMLIFL
jgi:hypothetical protein